MKKKAFVNGKIFTSDREKPYAESFIAEDGYITWIGNREDMPGGEYELSLIHIYILYISLPV